MKITIVLSLLWLFACPSFANSEPSEKDKQFIDAKKALNRGQMPEFYALKESLKNHHLQPYLEYYYIQSGY